MSTKNVLMLMIMIDWAYIGYDLAHVTNPKYLTCVLQCDNHVSFYFRWWRWRI
jgi:hypothetical protein